MGHARGSTSFPCQLPALQRLLPGLGSCSVVLGPRTGHRVGFTVALPCPVGHGSRATAV